MIILLHPRSTRPKNRRFPLSILSIAAIVDGTLQPDPASTLDRLAQDRNVEMLAVSVMPGPQMVAAMQLSREFRARHPKIPIVWGGYFPSLFPDAALNTNYIDIAVRGQGEDTFTDLLRALR